MLLEVTLYDFFCSPWSYLFSGIVRKQLVGTPAAPFLLSLVFLFIIYFIKFINDNDAMHWSVKFARLFSDMIVDLPLLCVSIILLDLYPYIGRMQYILIILLYLGILVLTTKCRCRFISLELKDIDSLIDWDAIKYPSYQLLAIVLFVAYLCYA